VATGADGAGRQRLRQEGETRQELIACCNVPIFLGALRRAALALCAAAARMEEGIHGRRGATSPISIYNCTRYHRRNGLRLSPFLAGATRFRLFANAPRKRAVPVILSNHGGVY